MNKKMLFSGLGIMGLEILAILSWMLLETYTVDMILAILVIAILNIVAVIFIIVGAFSEEESR